MGPLKCSCISSFGSHRFLSGSLSLFRLTDFKILPYSVHSLRVLTLFKNSLLQKCHHICCASSVILQLPGCVEWSNSMTAFLIASGIANLLSKKVHPFLKLKFRQYAFICFDNALHLCSPFSLMQSCTS